MDSPDHIIRALFQDALSESRATREYLAEHGKMISEVAARTDARLLAVESRVAAMSTRVDVLVRADQDLTAAQKARNEISARALELLSSRWISSILLVLSGASLSQVVELIVKRSIP